MNVSPTSSRTRRQSGFSLIEVLIAVVIVGILSAFAYPSYTEAVRRGHRVEARTALLDAAQFMQRFYSANDRFDQQRDGTAVSLPLASRQVPTQGPIRYRIVIAESTATGYRLEARPTGTMANDRCGTFTLNAVGQRNVTQATDTGANCWR